MGGARRLYNHKPIEQNTLDHFRPWSKLFPRNWERRIYVGTACWLAAFGGILYSTYKFGFTAVACYYWGPYMWVNFWLVLYTWLQHTSPEVPHFGDDEWTWVRGALCTTTSVARTSATTSSVTCRATTRSRQLSTSRPTSSRSACTTTTTTAS